MGWSATWTVSSHTQSFNVLHQSPLLSNLNLYLRILFSTHLTRSWTAMHKEPFLFQILFYCYYLKINFYFAEGDPPIESFYSASTFTCSISGRIL